MDGTGRKYFSEVAKACHPAAGPNCDSLSQIVPVVQFQWPSNTTIRSGTATSSSESQGEGKRPAPIAALVPSCKVDVRTLDAPQISNDMRDAQSGIQDGLIAKWDFTSTRSDLT